MAFLEARWPTGNHRGKVTVSWGDCPVSCSKKQKLCPDETCLMVKFWPLLHLKKHLCLFSS